jgi:hypothetical protein
MAQVTLTDLFRELHGQRFANRQELEAAVLEIFNRHVGELPIGYSYKDAIEGARARGWLITNGTAAGVKVDLGDALPSVAAGYTE